MSTSTHAPIADPAMFVGPVGKMVDELDPYTEGGKPAVLVTLLAGISAAVGTQPRVGKEPRQMPVSFWPVLVGPTGLGRKGTATGIAMKVIESGLSDFAEHSVVAGLPATGLGFANELAERSIRGVATPVMFVEEEMDAFISNARKDTKVGVYLRKAWDGANIAHRTSQTDLMVKKPHVAIVGHAQPKNWGAISGSKDATGGTYNRFFPVWSFQSKKLPVFTQVDPGELITRLGKRLAQIVNFASEVSDLTVPDDVAEVFERKHREICDALTQGSEELGQYTERAMAYMIRIAGLYALADKREALKVQDFDAALALVQYMVETVTYTLPEAEATGNDTPARVIAFIREAGDEGVTSSEIKRKFQRTPAAEVKAIVDSVPQIQAKRMRSEGGRPATLYSWIEVDAEEIDEDSDELADIAA
jgi:hypothetical protein